MIQNYWHMAKTKDKAWASIIATVSNYTVFSQSLVYPLLSCDREKLNSCLLWMCVATNYSGWAVLEM